MKKLPYGISDYERLIENDYYYIDKTMYIERIENLAEPYIIFLRPRKFGKTLFTSTIENYYDIKKEAKFQELFGETYIGKNPTKLKNSYYVLKFNFSGIDTSNEETTVNGFNTNQFKNLVSKNGKVRKWYEILKKGTESVVDRIFITGVAPITLDSLTSGFNISSDKTQDERFNEMMGFTKDEFTETDLVSMLFYLGYLTIDGEEVGYPVLKIPNNVMKEKFV